MQLSTKMAARLGDRVKLGHRVASVEQTNGGVLVTCGNGQKYKVRLIADTKGLQSSVFLYCLKYYLTWCD